MKKNKKVLIIDDERDFCFLLKSYLSKKNYSIQVANNLSRGMQLLEESDPDIIFLDNNLPDGLGWDMVPYIFSTYPGVKLNLISAYHPTSTLFEMKNLKIWEKPLDFRSIEKYL